MSAAGGRVTAGVGMSLVGQHAAERNQEATVYVGNLDAGGGVTEELLWELFLQAGPVVNVYVPKDRVSGGHQGYGFVEFRGEEDAEYAVKVMNMVKLFGKPLKVSKTSVDRRTAEVGANLFVGNLDPDIDEKLLYDTFSAFGVVITTPKVMRDPDTVRGQQVTGGTEDWQRARGASLSSRVWRPVCRSLTRLSCGAHALSSVSTGQQQGLWLCEL
jgi:splicing factor 3B subunit 4